MESLNRYEQFMHVYPFQRNTPNIESVVSAMPRNSESIKPLNRQAMFRDDGTLTDVPTAISEAPPYAQGEMEI